MKALVLSLITLVLFNCKQVEIPKTPNDLLMLNIKKTSHEGQWESLNTNSWRISQTTTIGGKIVSDMDIIHSYKFPAYNRIDKSINGELISIEYHSPDKNMIVSNNEGKKGYTNIPKKSIYKNPVFGLLDEVENLVLNDTLVGFESLYKLTNIKNKNIYLFDKIHFLLISKETQTNYGRQTESFQDYKQVGDYLFPTKVTRSIPKSGYFQEDIICDIKVNPILDDDTFTIDDSDRKILVGNTIPSFNFENLDIEGEYITNKSLKGKTVLLDFWATWCGPCIKEIPNIEKLYKKFNDKGFEVLSISFDTKEELVKNFRNTKYSLPWKNTILTKSFKDPQSILMEVSALPKVILINPEGKIIATDEDAKGKQLETFLNNLYTK